jgi:hypothetical protein
MKKLLILLAITMVACTKPENSNDSEFSTNELNLSPAENSDNRTAAVGTEENPILVDKNEFIDNVVYTLPLCGNEPRLITGTKIESKLYVRSGLFEIPVFDSYTYDKINKCIITNGAIVNVKTDFLIFTPGLYYKIFGEVVRLSVRDLVQNSDTFWYKNASGNQIQKVIFSKDGVNSIENPIPNPFKENIDCKGLKEVVVEFTKNSIPAGLVEGSLVVNKGTQNVYKIGQIDRDGYRNYFYIGTCGAGTLEPGVCSGIPAWVSGKQYVAGDKVVFKNTLYTKLVRGWQKGPKCY